MSINKAVFLDRDGVILQDTGYIHKTEDVILIPHITETLAYLTNLRYILVVISNQSGIARKYFTYDDLMKVDQEMKQKLGTIEIHSYYCPHHPDVNGHCDCRKPGIGLITQASHELSIDISESYFIGDKDTDIQAGKNAGCKATILLQHAQTKQYDYNGEDTPDYTITELPELKKFIHG